MTDHDTAQATQLIGALREQLADMLPKLDGLDVEATRGYPSRARAIRVDAAQLRRDISQAHFLIAQLRRRFPDADDTSAPAIRAPATTSAECRTVVG